MNNIAIANINLKAYAEIHCHDSSAAQTIPTGTSYTKITAWTDNGFSSNCTPDYINDKITITKTGIYKVSGAFSFTGNVANITWFMSLFVGGVESDNIHFTRKIGTSGDVGSASFTGLIDVTAANTDIDVRARHTNGADSDITISYANLNVQFLGNT